MARIEAAAGRHSAGLGGPPSRPCLTRVRRRHRTGDSVAGLRTPGRPQTVQQGPHQLFVAATWHRDLDRQSEGGRVRPPGSGVRRQLGPRAQPGALEAVGGQLELRRTVGVVDGQPDLPNTPAARRPPGLGAAVPALRWVGDSLSDPPSARRTTSVNRPLPLGMRGPQQGDPWAGPDTGTRSRTGLPGACSHLRLPGRGRGLGRSVFPRTSRAFGPGPREGRGVRALSLQRLNLGGKRWNPRTQGYCLTSYPPPRPPDTWGQLPAGDRTVPRKAQVPERSLLCREV